MTEESQGSNAAALARTLETLNDLGRIDLIDSAVVALCRSTAAAVDENPDRASLVKEYRECLILLGGLGADDDGDLDKLLNELGAASVGDTPPT
jgi:hypothetical protein